jgi:hypothetical protein
MSIVAARLAEDAPRSDAYVAHKASRTAQSYDQLPAPAQPYCLTERDVRCLEQAVAINGGKETPIGRAVTEKLGQMELRASIPHGYVTLGSNVVFRASGRPPINRTLVHWDHFSVPGFHLSLHTPWGVTLLGMKVGHTAPVYGRSGVVEELTVEAVSHPAAPAEANIVEPRLNRSRSQPPTDGRREGQIRRKVPNSEEATLPL